jgi:Vacuolar protein sorting-associated protein 62
VLEGGIGRLRRGGRIGALVLLAFVASVPEAVDAQGDEVQELVDRYAPIVMLRTQEAECDSDGEPFAPMAVELLLHNPQIALRQVGNGDPTVQRGPGASDLADLGEGFYLDYPGDALKPGCLYEQDHDRFNSGQPSVVYAHVAQQADRPDLLAVQYWLFWYYNDWNNKHEGDWEFIQLMFPAATVAEALATEPLSVGYAQHEGGERADWDDDKLDREDTHPVVFSSQRSHASYFGPALYMGRSASEGFGCDNSEEPSTRVEPDVVVLPDAVDDADDPLAWIGFEGRWGERHAAPNNGPTGPNTKPQWSEPVTWHDGLRDSSFVVPTADSRGSELINTFCGVVEWGSIQFINFVASPGRMLVVLAVLAAVVVFLVRRTSWLAVERVPLVRRRRAGEIARLSGATYWRHRGTFVAVGMIAVPVVTLSLLVGAIIGWLPLVGDLVTVTDTEGTGGRLAIASLIAGLFGVFAFVLIAAAVSWIVGGPGRARADAGESLQAVARRTGALATAFLPAAVIVVLLNLVVVGVPVAIWLVVRWQFIPQVTMLEGVGGWATLRRSAELVRSRWWHTALVTLLVLLLIIGVSVVVGLLALVLFTGLPLWSLSAIVAACEVLLMPYGALVMTYLYGDAVAPSTEVAADAAAEPVSV